MAEKTISDNGSADAFFGVTRRPNGDVVVEVTIHTSDGDVERVGLSRDEVIAATTAGDRSATIVALDKLYGAAIAKRGFA